MISGVKFIRKYRFKGKGFIQISGYPDIKTGGHPKEA